MGRVARGIHQVHIHTDWQDVPVMMDAAAVARVLGRRLETVRKALTDGRLPGQKVGGGWLVRKDALMAHLGYAQWEIERYGYGMATAPGEDGRGPLVTDGFKGALHRKEGEDGAQETPSVTAGGGATSLKREARAADSRPYGAAVSVNVEGEDGAQETPSVTAGGGATSLKREARAADSRPYGAAAGVNVEGETESLLSSVRGELPPSPPEAVPPPSRGRLGGVVAGARRTPSVTADGGASSLGEGASRRPCVDLNDIEVIAR